MDLVILLYSLLVKVATVTSVKHCYQCSDANIETHYGVFFVNPRVLQDGNRSDLKKCDRFSVPVVECNSSCFSLNVTSLHAKDREVLPFGTAHGCSQYVISEDIEDHSGCFKKDILLRTIPPYVVQAEYCNCDGDLCNSISYIVPVPPQRTSSGKHHFYVNNVKNPDNAVSFAFPSFLLVLYLFTQGP
ncbi:hypothetical protein RB195_020986 [Necator americanus]|uniref:Uncharacterized protein n=1 Tax=Necator americanus TaxID=51031 RepID=A0ABR1CLK0_NECAM